MIIGKPLKQQKKFNLAKDENSKENNHRCSLNCFSDLIYTFVNDAYEETKAHEIVKQGFLDQMEQNKAMERRNNKTAEEKCEEARENIKNYEVEARDLKEDNPDEEWVDHSIFKIKHSLREVEQALCKE